MTKIKDVTNNVIFENNDDEALSILECVCGHRYSSWDFIIGVYKEDSSDCPECGAKLFFRNSITVYQIEEEE